jgi:hypothetical protein
MIRGHSDEEVLERARQIDAGRRAGLTDVQIIELVAARAHWHANGQICPQHQVTDDLIEASNSDGAMVWDSVFTTALRRELRKLSDLRPNVTP